MRRGQGIGINIVIIAAIALLVLVIIALVVSSGGKNLSEGTKSCVASGGKCAESMPGDGWDLADDQRLHDSCNKDGETRYESCYVYQFG